MIRKILKKNILLPILAGIIYLLFSLATISDYNIMWDGRNHFFRGQAFANFFLFGRFDYKDLPITKEYARYYRDYAKSFTPEINIDKRLSVDPNYRRSIYQDEVHTYEWLMARPATGHPTISDTLSSFFNILFYEKLGWLRDDHAYGLYGVVLSGALVAVVFHWARVSYGLFPALVTTLVLTTTPLFWAESHYNIKDTPILVFFSLAIWAFWKGTVSQSKKWIILSSIFSGLALGTKFNIVFLPFILAPWFLVVYLSSTRESRKTFNKWWWLIVLYPMISLGILFIGWPQLWNHPIESFLSVVDYYRSVGIGVDYTPTFRTVFGFSTYATFWIFVTTYPFVLLLSAIGKVGWIIRVQKTKDFLPLLFLLWLFVPIARASLPNTSIFGGVRHIIEYIPALSLLSGYGTYTLLQSIPRILKIPAGLIILIAFVPFIAGLVRLHPAENAYFNSFIGGLSGAKEANLTGWGNTDGGIYRKAVVWLNENAEKNSHIATAFSEPADFYIPEFREDILADNQFSGYLQQGEYIVALTHNSELENTYRMLYPQTFLVPLYEYKIDGVALIKIWKNEKKYLKKEIALLSSREIELLPERKDGTLSWDLGDVAWLYKLELTFNEDKSCVGLAEAYVEISKDNSKWWTLPETYPGGSIEALGKQPSKGRFIHPMSGEKARYVRLNIDPPNACILNVKKSVIGVLVNE